MKMLLVVLLFAFSVVSYGMPSWCYVSMARYNQCVDWRLTYLYYNKGNPWEDPWIRMNMAVADNPMLGAIIQSAPSSSYRMIPSGPSQ